MEQVHALAPLRVMLVCCNELVPELLQAYLAKTQWWQPADGDICYGELKLHALVLVPVEGAQSGSLADSAQRFCGMQLERISVIRLQHDWLVPAEAMTRIELLALQHDWLVFVDPQALAHAGPVSLREHLNSMAMLQLLVAEHLHSALISSATLMSSGTTPAFIQCQWDNNPADWPDFYQQLDINSRWQSVIYCRWLLTYPAVPNQPTRSVAGAQQQASGFAAQLYLLLLAGLPSDIGPWLNDLAPRYLTSASFASARLLTQPSWLDWHVLIGEATQARTDFTYKTEPTIQYEVPSASAYNADVQLTAIAMQQGSLLDSSPLLNCQSHSHHLFSQLRVCVKQLPAQLPITHLLLLQSQRERPRWQLQGYWRLRLV